MHPPDPTNPPPPDPLPPTPPLPPAGPVPPAGSMPAGPVPPGGPGFVGVPEGRRRTGVVVLAIVVPVVLALGLLAGAGYLVFGRHGSGQPGPAGSSVPSGWPTVGFVVDGPGAAGTQVRRQVGELLVARAGRGARFEVRPHGVLVAMASRTALDRVRALAPLRTDVEFRPVVSTVTASSGPSGPPPAAPGSPTGPPPADTASPTVPPASPLASPSDQTGAEQLPSLDGRTGYQLGPVAMTGTVVRSASAGPSTNGNGWEVTVSLDGTGARQFGDLTARLVDQQLAIVVAGRVVQAPTIESAITGGQLSVSGGFNRSDAEGLAAAFQLGRHPVTATLGDPN